MSKLSILSPILCILPLLACSTPADEESESCDKVDILFVVDNSGSMGDNQQNLVNNFSKFADNIRTALGEDTDYHVGVVTSDAYSGNDPTCSQLGALVTQTGGDESSNRSCGPFKSGRFLSKDDALVSGFQCIAQVGSSGNGNEDVIGAAAASLAHVVNAPGACNAGFLRPDSLLVLVLITDEDTVTGSETATQLLAELGQSVGVGTGPEDLPAAWQTRIAQQSGHEPNATVVVTLTKGVPGNQCAAEEVGQDGTTLLAFTDKYKYHFVGDICAPDYGDVLVKALEPVSTACKNYSQEVSGSSDEGTCAENGPGVRDWLFSTLAVLGASALLTMVGLGTLSRSLARSGYRQSNANGAGIGFGLTLGGTVGIVTAVARECGVGSSPGIFGVVVTLVGLVVLIAHLVSGKR